MKLNVDGLEIETERLIIKLESCMEMKSLFDEKNFYEAIKTFSIEELKTAKQLIESLIEWRELNARI